MNLLLEGVEYGRVVEGVGRVQVPRHVVQHCQHVLIQLHGTVSHGRRYTSDIMDVYIAGCQIFF